MKSIINSNFASFVSVGARRARVALPVISALSALAALTFSSVAGATPRPLPFTYPVDTLPEGASELELYTDVNPLRVNADPTDPTAGRLWEPQYILQSEFEYGIADRWEFGFYQRFKAEPEDGGTNHMTFDGLKWRIRTRLADPGEWPVDVGLYLELETLHDEWALEEKVLLQKSFGKLRWMGNLWVEQEIERPFDKGNHPLQFIINPATGFTYQVTPTFHPGIEYWARGTLNPPEGESEIDHRNRIVHHYVGPTTHLNFGKLWLTLGLYAHLNDINKPQPGEEYGPFWFRSVLGVDL